MKNHMTESMLLTSIRNGDVNGYICLYDIYKEKLMLYAVQKLGDYDQAEDLIQDLFLSLWTNREELPDIQNLNAYLLQSMRNKVLNSLRKKKSESNYLESLGNYLANRTEHADSKLYEQELSDTIRKEIEQLPARMQEVFKMSREEGMTHKQISEKTGTTEQTISKQITNTLRILRSKLRPFLFFL